MGALLMAAFKIAVTPFLTSIGGGLGSHVAEWVWGTVSGAGHPQVAEKMKTGTASPDEQKTAQQVVAAAITEPPKAQALQQVAATNPVAQPIAQNYASLLSAQPEAWTEFANGSATLTQLEESRARTFGWSAEQIKFDSTGRCPVGGEELPLSGVTFIDVTGKTFLSAWVFRKDYPVVGADGQFHPYTMTGHCPSGHQWPVYAS